MQKESAGMKLPEFLRQFSFQREPVWMLVILFGPTLLLFLTFTLIRLVR